MVATPPVRGARTPSSGRSGESFTLLDHGAQLLGRYDFLKDVSRLQQVVAVNPAVRGYAILLTNDSSY